MLLTITSTAEAATDLGYLLHKHPDRVQQFDLPAGRAHVYYPEAADDRCTVALLLEVDPVALVRSRRGGGDPGTLTQYVNDRPYAASSLLAVAIGKVFGTAMKGRCPTRPDLEGAVLPLTVRLPAVPDEASLVQRLFGPLGWEVWAEPVELDPEVTAWGLSRYVDLTLTGSMTLSAALTHLYVLLPVLDGSKHYWVGTDEVDKLVRSGGSWLGRHPERDLIARRYLAHQRAYVADATERLAALDDAPVEGLVERGVATLPSPAPEAAEARTPLVELRRMAVLQALHDVGAHRVVDLGCGEGGLLRAMLADPFFTEVVGVDVSARELEKAARRLDLDRMGDRQRSRVSLRQSSATYRDRALEGYDAVALVEVVEHVDPERLPALERSVFGHARPRAVVVTTPNADYNPLYPTLAAGAMRHPDHRFEWGRDEFAGWCQRVAAQYGYAVETRSVGEVDETLGAATQLALFARTSGPA